MVVRCYRWRVVVAGLGLLVAAALSGCTAPDPMPADQSGDANGTEGATGGAPGGGDDEAGNATGAVVIPARMHHGGCSVQSITFAVPSLILEEELPAGFSLVHPDPAGLTALMGMAAIDCGNVTAEGIDAMDHAEMRIFVYVEPPAEYRDPRVEGYQLQFQSLVSEEAVVEVYRLWGHWAYAAQVDVAVTDVGAARVGVASAQDDWESWEIYTVVESTAPECWETFLVRSFADGQEGVVGFVDLEFGAGCAMTGAGKFVLAEPWSADPTDVAFWLLLNGVTTGVGNHFVGDDLHITQRYTRFGS